MSKFPEIVFRVALSVSLTGAAAAQGQSDATDALNLTEAKPVQVEKVTEAVPDDEQHITKDASKKLDSVPVGAGLVMALGRTALPEEIAAWDIDVRPDGMGLPPGQGSVEDGETIFADSCALCHGDFAEGVDRWPSLAGGIGTLGDADPDKTVGSYWPYLSTSFDYIRRAMPFGNAHSLTNDEVYATIAYILNMNDIIADDFVLSRETFLTVEMPNADGFILDDRDEIEVPQFSQAPCMVNCKADPPEITRHASILDVTPETPDEGDEAPPPMK